MSKDKDKTVQINEGLQGAKSLMPRVVAVEKSLAGAANLKPQPLKQGQGSGQSNSGGQGNATGNGGSSGSQGGGITSDTGSSGKD